MLSFQWCKGHFPPMVQVSWPSNQWFFNKSTWCSAVGKAVINWHGEHVTYLLIWNLKKNSIQCVSIMGFERQLEAWCGGPGNKNIYPRTPFKTHWHPNLIWVSERPIFSSQLKGHFPHVDVSFQNEIMCHVLSNQGYLTNGHDIELSVSLWSMAPWACYISINLKFIKLDPMC